MAGQGDDKKTGYNAIEAIRTQARQVVQGNPVQSDPDVTNPETGFRKLSRLAGTARRQAEALGERDDVKARALQARQVARELAERGNRTSVFAALGAFVRAHWIGLAIFVVGYWIIAWSVRAPYFDMLDTSDSFRARNILEQIDLQVRWNIMAAFGGLAAGFLPVMIFTRYRDIALAALGLVVVYFVLQPQTGGYMPILSGVFAFVVGIAAALWMAGEKNGTPDTFGTARWATLADIHENGLDSETGYRLGTFESPKAPPLTLRYSGARHLLTVAPTRAGKGVSAIIPNLLTYPGSVLVIDPKGENALITAEARLSDGQDVMLLDPWDLASSRLGLPPARVNPLDWLDPGDPDVAENAMILADALVTSSGSGEPFWEEEAKALIMGIILHVATDPKEATQRHLGRVRDLLVASKEEREELWQAMNESGNSVVMAAAARAESKSEKLFSSVLAVAQAQTHMLDSPRLRESLAASDFDFTDLKKGNLSVYLILPADRLHTFSRWMRMMIQQAITLNARDISVKPEYPALFLLDEMPALGRLKAIEEAYGLMAGFGMQLWGIVQDLSQLKSVYGDGWETFVSNSGVLQYFGSRDYMTADYFSKLCGASTVWSVSQSVADASGYGTTNNAPARRDLATPDELMTLRDGRQIILVENGYPIQARRTPWFEDPKLREIGVNLQEPAAG